MKSQEQFNAEYSELCTKLGHAIAQEQQSVDEQYALKLKIQQLKNELNDAVEAAKVAAEAQAKLDAEQPKDVTPEPVA